MPALYIILKLFKIHASEAETTRPIDDPRVVKKNVSQIKIFNTSLDLNPKLRRVPISLLRSLIILIKVLITDSVEITRITTVTKFLKIAKKSIVLR